MKLSKSDWNTLDNLLGQIGFGGYYDLIQGLKQIICQLYPSKELEQEIQNETDLYTLVQILLTVTKKT